MTRKLLREMWVLGVAYAPVLNVRMYNTREKGYLFHTDFNDSEWAVLAMSRGSGSEGR